MDEEQEITMDILTDAEKAAIDDAPTSLFDFLYENILDNGRMPSYFTITLVTEKLQVTTSITYEGDKVDAALMYYEYLIENGYRKESDE